MQDLSHRHQVTSAAKYNMCKRICLNDIGTGTYRQLTQYMLTHMVLGQRRSYGEEENATNVLRAAESDLHTYMSFVLNMTKRCCYY